MAAGTGTPVLLIPAIGLSAPVWTPQFEQWSANHQVIVVHQQGYGLTEMNSDISFAGVTRLFIEVLDRLGIKRPIHVVGSCFGGVAAIYEQHGTLSGRLPDKKTVKLCNTCEGLTEVRKAGIIVLSYN